jgi:LmbE family N-acetylglucosaminyl deacetylase
MPPTNNRVLALMPHPDDCELLCAGTLIRLHEIGWEVHIATMTPGDEGSAEMDADVIAGIRREEARKGAETIGARSYTCLEFRDCQIVFDNPSRRKVARFVREIAPALVITTPPADYMLDHELTSTLVRDACFNISLRNYDTGKGPETPIPIPYLYYTDPLAGRDILGRPSPVTTVVDISETMGRKVEALKCHDSQRSWLLKQQGMDNYVETMRAWAATRGEQIGAAFAEAFHQHLGQAYPQDDLLASLLSVSGTV